MFLEEKTYRNNKLEKKNNNIINFRGEKSFTKRKKIKVNDKLYEVWAIQSYILDKSFFL